MLPLCLFFALCLFVCHSVLSDCLVCLSCLSFCLFACLSVRLSVRLFSFSVFFFLSTHVLCIQPLLDGVSLPAPTRIEASHQRFVSSCKAEAAHAIATLYSHRGGAHTTLVLCQTSQRCALFASSLSEGDLSCAIAGKERLKCRSGLL
jgi:hypothetical protein